jgi:hypothetical protein
MYFGSAGSDQTTRRWSSHRLILLMSGSYPHFPD